MPRFLGCHMYFMSCFFCFQAPISLGGHSGQPSLHLSHQWNRGFSLRTPRKRKKQVMPFIYHTVYIYLSEYSIVFLPIVLVNICTYTDTVHCRGLKRFNQASLVLGQEIYFISLITYLMFYTILRYLLIFSSILAHQAANMDFL